jgi:Tfp pilus assembly protein PilF
MMPDASAFRYFLLTAIVVIGATGCGRAPAKMVEVAPGVSVTKTTFSAPLNEQPFYGFAEKTALQREADAKFVAAAEKLTGSREKAFSETMHRAWKAFFAGDLAVAARRFNEAYLIDPTQSGVYHGLGLIAFERFHDPVFADELLRIARTQPNPSPVLNADYGRFLLVNKRPRDAEPVLEQAVRDAPNFPAAWSNLAWARLQNGNNAEVCTAVSQAAALSPPGDVQADIKMLRSRAGCA